MTAASVFVAGHLYVVSVSSDSVPETKHDCTIQAPHRRPRNLSLINQRKQSLIDSKGRLVIRVRSDFSLNASRTDENAVIVCSGGTGFNAGQNLIARQEISAISDPCQTFVNLTSPGSHWLVGDSRRVAVNSSSCSAWNVTHSCWLELDHSGVAVTLRKVRQEEFSSLHELRVIEAMILNDWTIWCSVNQSGFIYPNEQMEPRRDLVVFGLSSKAKITVTVNQDCSDHLHVQVKEEDQQPVLPVSNVTCQIVRFDNEPSVESKEVLQLFPMRLADRGTWSWEVSLATPRAAHSLTKLIVRCIAMQYHRGQLVHQTVDEASVDTDDGCFCVRRRHLMYYIAAAVVGEIALLVAVVVLVRAVCLRRSRPQTPNQELIPQSVEIPMQPTSSDSETYDYPNIGDVLPDKNELKAAPMTPLPPIPLPLRFADSSNYAYINSRKN